MNAAASTEHDSGALAGAPDGERARKRETAPIDEPAANDAAAAPPDGIVHEPTLDGEPRSGTEQDWTTRLAGVMHRSRGELGSRLHTTLSCNVRNGRPVLFLPPEMGSLQPRSLAYLRTFARRHGFGLVEDRREIDIRPLVEQRDRTPSTLAMGISLLLKQTGMPGGARTLSSPHRLAAGSPHVELDRLVRMAARVRERSKRVVMLPNRMIVEATGSDTRPIVGRACRIGNADAATVLSQFDSPSFRCIGYSTGHQYVMHVFLAGGLAGAPELWTRLHTLTHTDFRFRLFPGTRPARDFGLLHATFHYDVAHDAGAPWWVSSGVEAPGPALSASAIDPARTAH